MTHTTTVLEEGNAGDHAYVIAEVDITSLDSGGIENFDPDSELGLKPVYGAAVLGSGNISFEFAFDDANNDINVSFRGGAKSATTTQDVGSISGGDTATFTVSLSDVGTGTPVAVSPPSGLNEDLTVTANMTSGNTATVTVSNPTSGSIDPASGDYTVVAVPEQPRLAPQNADVGTVTLKFEGDYAP